MGGVRPLPILEDVDLCLRVRRVGAVVTLGGATLGGATLGGTGAGAGTGSAGGGGGDSGGSGGSSGSGGSDSGGGGAAASKSGAPSPAEPNGNAEVRSDAEALTSPRRFAAAGLWRQCLKNQLILAAYASGLASPEQISRWY